MVENDINLKEVQPYGSDHEKKKGESKLKNSLWVKILYLYACDSKANVKKS